MDKESLLELFVRTAGEGEDIILTKLDNANQGSNYVAYVNGKQVEFDWSYNNPAQTFLELEKLANEKGICLAYDVDKEIDKNFELVWIEREDDPESMARMYDHFLQTDRKIDQREREVLLLLT